MNNNIKNIVFLFIACVFCIPAFAADVSERTDCESLQARINTLSAIDAPDEAQTAELNKLQSEYRNNCSKSAAGRRTSAASRVTSATATATMAQDTASAVQTVIITAQSILNDYLTDRQNLCNELSANINNLRTAGTSDAELQKLQNQYNNDCSSIDQSAVVEVDIETAAANVAAGLCTDGSKPNKFGCCEGETFKDIGNLVFACCPDDGGECYPPITTGNAI